MYFAYSQTSQIVNDLSQSNDKMDRKVEFEEYLGYNRCNSKLSIILLISMKKLVELIHIKKKTGSLISDGDLTGKKHKNRLYHCFIDETQYANLIPLFDLQRIYFSRL